MSGYKAQPLNINLGPTDASDAMGRTAILYGDSTAGKSTQLAAAAEYLASKHGKPVRLISAEDSSKTVFLPLIMGGLVDALFISKIPEPVSSLRKLARGEWVKDGQWTPPDRGSACAYIIEGLSSIAELIQEDNREHSRFLGEQKANSHVENGEVMSLPGQFSYYFTQLEMMRLLKSFAMIPGLDRVLWSAHEANGVEEGTGQQLRGPATVGKKRIDEVKKYCGLLLHLDTLADKGKRIHRLHFVTHPDPKLPTIMSPAKMTLPLAAQSRFNQLIGAQAGGYVDTTVNDGVLVNSLADVLRIEDQVMEEMISKYSKKA